MFPTTGGEIVTFLVRPKLTNSIKIYVCIQLTDKSESTKAFNLNLTDG